MIESVAVDFDGTLVEDNFPEIGKPKETIINFVKILKQYGIKLILWTCRNGDALQQAVDWCTQHGLEFDAVNQNLPEIQERYGGDTRKVMADYYLDDKNISLTSHIHTIAEVVCEEVYNKSSRE